MIHMTESECVAQSGCAFFGVEGYGCSDSDSSSTPSSTLSASEIALIAISAAAVIACCLALALVLYFFHRQKLATQPALAQVMPVALEAYKAEIAVSKGEEHPLPAGKRYHFFMSHKKSHTVHGSQPEALALSLHDTLSALGFEGFFDVDNLKVIDCQP